MSEQDIYEVMINEGIAVEMGLDRDAGDIPDYWNNIEAIRAAVREKFKRSDELIRFTQELQAVLCMEHKWPSFDTPPFILIFAEAKHWCEAFLRILRKWTHE